MVTVPAHSFSAPTRALVIAAARLIPGVWGVLESSVPAFTTRTPAVRQSVALGSDTLSSAGGWHVWRRITIGGRPRSRRRWRATQCATLDVSVRRAPGLDPFTH